MIFILNDTNTIANNFLYELRDEILQKERVKFRKNMERLGELMAYEISKSFTYYEKITNTPLGEARVNYTSDQIVLVPILRAALPFYQGFLNFFDDADSGFVGSFRSSETKGMDVKIQMDYLTCPDLTGKILILIDPMLATGNSFVKAIRALLEYGIPNKIHIVSIIAASVGIEYIQEELKDYNLSTWICAMDNKLDHKAYIVPGLGDAGDLCFGEKN